MNKVIKRLQEEVKDLDANPVDNCSAGPFKDDMMHWQATIFGPENTPYENGFYFFSLRFPESYPNEPVKMWYYTTHSNIRSRAIW